MKTAGKSSSTKAPRKSQQLGFFSPQRSDYGGSLATTRKGRSGPRPLATKKTMHIVLRSSQAVGRYSFRRHDSKIRQILQRFGHRHNVRVLSLANVGNHLHLHIQLRQRGGYAPFIRAVTASIMMLVTGVSRWHKPTEGPSSTKRKFWDLRPFSRILSSFTERLNLKDYLAINRYQNLGYSKLEARFIYNWNKTAWSG